MKALFLHFYDFSLHSGISKKILDQIGALRECGLDVDLCYVKIDESGCHKRVCGDDVIENFGNQFWAKIVKWFRFKSLTAYILSRDIKFVYIRSFYNTTPPLINMLKTLKKAGVVVVMEMPTYPYDIEVKNSPLDLKFLFFINRLYRNKLKNCLARIVTFSNFKIIHGVKTINISNGIDFGKIKLKSKSPKEPDKINLISVADIHYWHGFDRLINGLGEYYKKLNAVEVSFQIIGDGVTSEVEMLKKLTIDLDLSKYVHFHGNRSGDELDNFFEMADFGIASLGRHRSGIKNIKTLKNREYAARGIPFIYSEEDDDFEKMPYILKVPADESPIDIQSIVDFNKSLKLTPYEIRESIVNSLSWKMQMQKVINESFNE